MVDSHPHKIVVAHVILSLEIGGMEQVVVDLVKAMDRSKFEPVVICIMRLGPLGEELKALGFSVFILPPLTPIISFLYPTPLVKILKQVGADVVHIHSGCWFKGVVGARFCAVKRVIYTLHGATYGRTVVTKLMERFAAALTDRIVTVSSNLKDQLALAGRIPMGKVSVTINGIDTQKFSALPTPSSANPLRIGTIARFEPVKDLATLLRAMKILKDGGLLPALDLIGDGSERGALELLSVELGLTGQVCFHGFQRETPKYLAAIDIFALSSISEGTSISILEAMAAGKPIVATAVGGNPALVEDGVNGLLVPPGDPAALAQALKRLIGDESLRLQIGTVNREKARLEFGLAAMTRQYEGLYGAR